MSHWLPAANVGADTMVAPAVVLCMTSDIVADVIGAVVEETSKDLVEGARLGTTADLAEDIDLEIAEEIAEDLADESSLDMAEDLGVDITFEAVEDLLESIGLDALGEVGEDTELEGADLIPGLLVEMIDKLVKFSRELLGSFPVAVVTSGYAISSVPPVTSSTFIDSLAQETEEAWTQSPVMTDLEIVEEIAEDLADESTLDMAEGLGVDITFEAVEDLLESVGLDALGEVVEETELEGADFVPGL